MIPVRLKLSGFLSYRDPVEIDFTGFDLACISGPNGSGKSSLLDAITWALFGQARKRDEALIYTNPKIKAAEVIYTFAYENNLYRVQRTMPRGKTTALEFQIQKKEAGEQTWRPLTERTLRETQARIEQILRLDYDTFVNAAFFLQGKADQFTQQPPSKRKEILSNILGLEIWEIYRQRTYERRKASEVALGETDGRITEINAELAEEPTRKARLAEMEAELLRLSTARKVQEVTLESINRVQASLEKQREMVASLETQLERTRNNLDNLEKRLEEIQTRRKEMVEIQKHAEEIESGYQTLHKVRAALERWETIAAEFREHEKRRQPLLEEISSERARLEQELATLEKQKKELDGQTSSINQIESEQAASEQKLKDAEAKLVQQAEIEAKVQYQRERQAEMRAENAAMKSEMEELKARIDKLKESDGANCPLCGQPLKPEERNELIARLSTQGTELGNHWRANKEALAESAAGISGLESQLATLTGAENERVAHAALISQLSERLNGLKRVASAWEANDAPRLKEIVRLLEEQTFASEARSRLAKVDQELAALGYDTTAHEKARQAESEGRAIEEKYRTLEVARAALKPLEDEIANLATQIINLQSEIQEQQLKYDSAISILSEAESQAPDLTSAERALFDLREQENQFNQEVGAARQNVAVLADLRTRKKKLEVEREEIGTQIGYLKTLERAFGKDGVPALLIEQALPEIEIKANELLDRLSNGMMSLRFVTQAKYKDQRREDLKETLEIQISDSAGSRDYEMFSGGEAFRINFAIRLALSKVLAQRKGARLQTLVIDEGFGSQDTQGRQRLIEAINAVHNEFAMILVITHLNELKDTFPTRIEVEKNERGSSVQVF